MDLSLASWIVLAAAFAAANLPFASERVFGVFPLARTQAVQGDASGPSLRTKPFLVRLLELIALYFLIGALAYGLESRIGNVFAQRWEFYAITGCLFVVLAFPGFVVRYLRKRH